MSWFTNKSIKGALGAEMPITDWLTGWLERRQAKKKFRPSNESKGSYIPPSLNLPPPPPPGYTRPIITGGPEHDGLGVIASGIIKLLKMEPDKWVMNDFGSLKFYYHNDSGVRITVRGACTFGDEGDFYDCEPEIADYEKGAIEQAVKEYDTQSKIKRELQAQAQKKEQLEKATAYLKNL